MPKFLCKCGHIIPAGEIPTPDQWNIISDVEFDSFPELIDASAFYRQMTIALKCRVCERFYIFWNGWSEEPTCYEKSSN